MNDMSAVIVPKSDQINAEDFLAGPGTFTIEAVAISPGTEQPVSIKLDGERRVWRPCKSMSRVLVSGWGADANAYVGRSVTLYCDPKVKWGGLEVGGIRVSHMSHIERDMVMSLTATKGKRAPHQVKVLQVQQSGPGKAAQSEDRAAAWTASFIRHIAKIESAETIPGFQAQHQAKINDLRGKRPELAKQIDDALANRLADLSDEDPFGLTPIDGRADSDFGDEHDDTNEGAN